MKKILMMMLILFLAFTINSVSTKASDDLYSELVKQEANRHCNIQIASLGIETPSNGIEIPSNGIEIPSNTGEGWKDQVLITDKGSKIVMSTEPGKEYGYCHIFQKHMKNSNGKKEHELIISGEWKSQFKYARFPNNLAQNIILDVINNQITLVPDKKIANRFTKTFYSSVEGQRVTVALHRGSSWRGYTNYDWVIVSAYPVW